MIIESYSEICSECAGKGYILLRICSACDGNGAVIVNEERRTLEAALASYSKWAKGFRAALKGIGVQ